MGNVVVVDVVIRGIMNAHTRIIEDVEMMVVIREDRNRTVHVEATVFSMISVQLSGRLRTWPCSMVQPVEISNYS